MSVKTPDEGSEPMSDAMSKYRQQVGTLCQGECQKEHGNTSDRMPENMSDSMSEHMPEYISNSMSQYMSNKMLNKVMSDKMQR